MRHLDRIAALLLATAAGIASGCVEPDGAPSDIAGLAKKRLTVRHIGIGGGGISAELAYDWIGTRCAVLVDSAFARLNGEDVPLFRGEVVVIPPMGDDGGVSCTFPSVTVDYIPGSRTLPWTLEIGDASEVVTATFGPGPANPFQAEPPASQPLGNARGDLSIPFVRASGAAAAVNARATATASDGRTSVQDGQVQDAVIVFRGLIASTWPPGPVTIEVFMRSYPLDTLQGCENAECTFSQGPELGGHLPDPATTGDPLASDTTTTYTADLTCDLLLALGGSCPP